MLVLGMILVASSRSNKTLGGQLLENGKRYEAKIISVRVSRSGRYNIIKRYPLAEFVDDEEVVQRIELAPNASVKENQKVKILYSANDPRAADIDGALGYFAHSRRLLLFSGVPFILALFFIVVAIYRYLKVKELNRMESRGVRRGLFF